MATIIKYHQPLLSPFVSSLSSPSARLQSADRNETRGGPAPIMLCRRKQEEAWSSQWTGAQRKTARWLMQRPPAGEVRPTLPPVCIQAAPSLWVSPPSQELRNSDRWMLPVDLKGQCSKSCQDRGVFLHHNAADTTVTD